MNVKNIIIILFVTICIVSAKKDRIRLKDVEALTLYSDKWTTSRRSAPVKQLTCVGGYCNQATVETAQCYNRGFDGNDIQWECKAELPSNYKFSRLEVSCEGYEYPDDDYILAGSCGLEYTISEVSKTSSSFFSSLPNYNKGVKDNNGTSWVSIVVFIAIGLALYYYLQSNDTPAPNGPNSNDNRSWFSGSSSAPPPPGFRPDFTSNNNPSGTSTANGPGFFSGMAAGGFLGYLFGSNRGNYGYERRGHYDRSFWNTPSTAGYSSFGGSSYSRGSRSSDSTRTSTSTGFASTKRR